MRLGGRHAPPPKKPDVLAEPRDDGSLLLAPTEEGAAAVVVPPTPPGDGAYTLQAVDGEWTYVLVTDDPVAQEADPAVAAKATQSRRKR